jgi:hypothetical protein
VWCGVFFQEPLRNSITRSCLQPAAHQTGEEEEEEEEPSSSRSPLFNPDRPRGFLTKFIKAFVGHFLSFFVITFSFRPPNQLSLTKTLNETEGENNRKTSGI